MMLLVKQNMTAMKISTKKTLMTIMMLTVKKK